MQHASIVSVGGNKVVLRKAMQFDSGALPIDLEYKYASEATDAEGDACKLGLTLNGAPEILVTDATKNAVVDGKLKGFDCYRQEMVCVPEDLSLYTCGFVCKDRSFANTRGAKELDEEANEDSGDSTTTLHASVRMILETHPKKFMLEHTFRKDTVQKLRKLFNSKLPDYKHRIWVTCSGQWGLPQRRRRIYCCGVNTRKCRLKLPMEKWTPILQKMAANQIEEPLRLQDCVLEDTHKDPLSL